MNEENITMNASPTPEAEPQERVNTMTSFGFSAPEPVLGNADAPLPTPEPVLAPPIPVAAPAVSAPNFDDPEPKPAKKRRSVPLGVFIAIVLVFAILFGCAGASIYLLYNYCTEMEDTQNALNSACNELEIAYMGSQTRVSALEEKLNALTGIDSTTDAGMHLTPSQIYAMNVNAVVSVSCLVSSGPVSGYSTGSGFILEDGYILTNAHVVENATEIHVYTYSDQDLVATLVGKDSLNDVALLKVNAPNLPYVTLGSSADVAVGEQVAAIGNPLGSLSFSMTVGYVSAKDRIVNTEGTTTNMIQTDVAINSGNSGGPLFNMAGQVIGITSAKYSGESASGATIEGISFAIPIDDVKLLIEELKEKGTVSYAYLGVSVQDVLADNTANTPAGAKVLETFDGYTAQRSGILAGDIIVKLDTYSVTSVSTLTMSLKNFKPGDSVDVVVFRNGEEVTIPVILDERPED